MQSQDITFLHPLPTAASFAPRNLAPGRVQGDREFAVRGAESVEFVCEPDVHATSDPTNCCLCRVI